MTTRWKLWPALILLGLLAPLQAAQSQVATQAGPVAGIDQAAESKAIDAASAFITSGKPAEAISILDKLIADRERVHGSDTRLIFNSRSTAEAIVYSGLAVQQKRDSVVYGENWSLAYFLKGFALIDLNRPAEAKPMYDKALALSPMNSHYLGELAEWHKNNKDFPAALDMFARALDAAEFSPDEAKVFDGTRALRGMAFILIEQGKLDEAEKRLNEALKMDPNDAKAKGELQYIADRRAQLRKGA
ncbi:MAG: tetratricopeptide repeat protein [Alphaproteobacteria bacterium]|nr:MAG: tetratricopeptide repeat protein [Alphaproteobacteria bacterium]